MELLRRTAHLGADRGVGSGSPDHLRRASVEEGRLTRARRAAAVGAAALAVAAEIAAPAGDAWLTLLDASVALAFAAGAAARGALAPRAAGLGVAPAAGRGPGAPGGRRLPLPPPAPVAP